MAKKQNQDYPYYWREIFLKRLIELVNAYGIYSNLTDITLWQIHNEALHEAYKEGFEFGSKIKRG